MAPVLTGDSEARLYRTSTVLATRCRWPRENNKLEPERRAAASLHLRVFGDGEPEKGNVLLLSTLPVHHERNDMKLVSVNCGMPRQVLWHGQAVTTSIYKEPVRGRIPLRTLNLDGDRQSDLTVHGGTHKAVYFYPSEYYTYWGAELQGYPLPFGSFGENFTVEGLAQDRLAEDNIHVGDRFSVGSAEVMVTQPRLPCYKLGIRLERDDMIKRFLHSRRTGFYVAVTREGDVGSGDELIMLSHHSDSVSISEITRLYIEKEYGPEDARQVRRAIAAEGLPDSWKTWFQEKLDRLGA